MKKLPLRYCFNCGAELGCYADYHPLDTCGMLECEKVAAEEARQEARDKFNEWASRERYDQ